MEDEQLGKCPKCQYDKRALTHEMPVRQVVRPVCKDCWERWDTDTFWGQIWNMLIGKDS